MHAVLTISASHLNYLLPQQAENKRAMNIYLSRTLPGFRSGVGTIASLQDTDAVIACGFLLLYYAWDDSNQSIDSDGLLWFATGLSEVITAAYTIQSQDGTNNGIFHNYAIPQYAQMLLDIRTRTASAASYLSYDFDGNFLGRHKLSDQVQDSVSQGGGCREIRLENRLGPIFYTVDSFTLGLDLTGFLPSFMAYSLTWPTKAPKDFVNQINAGESHALLVLLSFYSSVWLTLSNEVWWAHRRCRMMCELILSQLTYQKESFWSENITRIAEYFNFNQKTNGTWEVGCPSPTRI
ncbi:hypothetical protein TSTA_092870 [Talaromyces stipitatus ATCC 10500]|uniref:C6 transcription factor n=1 Tax=Talaromyces stipitatus (strain ATCC 10500 / CBS 375.48 / QM 6759 / NRRL 1006) TaxID=441959 RepID=B8M365_TALSN|nr:uncharacterized protein TSTA_092870 [Talaromyces stipitatus ATCC 10500]EED22041.1 hypothetical protein TSTA_092870 [Talaromyces stipitatus ATCC 10500]